jgi:hypothetical protein
MQLIWSKQSILSRDEVIMNGIWFVIGFIVHFNTQLVTKLYKTLSHTD